MLSFLGNALRFSVEQPSIVEPRAYSRDGELRKLVELVDEQINQGTRLIRITGDGKTTAMAHLAGHFSDSPEIRFLDDNTEATGNHSSATLFTKWSAQKNVTEFRLAKWNLDDCIEYVMARQPDQCKSVISRLVEANDLWLASGSPRVITAALDQMIKHPNLNSIHSALQSHFQNKKLSRWRMNKILSICFCHLLDDSQARIRIEQLLAKWTRDKDLLKMLRLQTVRYVMAIDILIKRIAAGRIPTCFKRLWTPALIEFFADAVDDTESHQTIAHLNRLANNRNDKCSSNAASILFHIDASWKPSRQSHLGFEGGNFSGANWIHLTAKKSLLSNVDFSHADLSHCNLDSSIVSSSDFSDANLIEARLDLLTARRTDFSRANLRRCRCHYSDFQNAIFKNADMETGDYALSNFVRADMTGVNLSQANLSETTFILANLSYATLVGSCLEQANLSLVDLRTTDISAAQFNACVMQRTNLAKQNLQETDFDRTDLRQSDWSDSRVICCSFERCNFEGAVLGNVTWTDCNLKHADFSGCQFFYGSTRSGLVGSPFPSHGTRTGFYTDDFEDQYFKRIEEIRKASFCGCDFRGAKVENTDFYLVDLRGAIYDEDQKLHFQKCGAILKD